MFITRSKKTSFQFRQPDVYCFSAPVKQRKDELPQITFVKKQATSTILPNQGIYLGEEEKPRRPSIVPPPKPPRTDKRVLSEKRRREQQKLEAAAKAESTRELFLNYASRDSSSETQPQKPTGLLIDVGPPLPVTSIVRSVSEYKASGLSMDIRAKMAKSSTQNAFDVSPSSNLIRYSRQSYFSSLRDIAATTRGSGIGNALCGGQFDVRNLYD